MIFIIALVFLITMVLINNFFQNRAVRSILILINAVTFIGCILLYYDFETVKTVCTNEATVVEIVSVDYRHSTALMSNGNTETFNQRTYKPGDVMCLEYGKELMKTDKTRDYRS